MASNLFSVDDDIRAHSASVAREDPGHLDHGVLRLRVRHASVVRADLSSGPPRKADGRRKRGLLASPRRLTFPRLTSASSKVAEQWRYFYQQRKGIRAHPEGTIVVLLPRYPISITS